MLAEAPHDEPALLLIEIEPGGGLAPQNVVQGGYTVDLRGHRRPDLYGMIVEEN